MNIFNRMSISSVAILIICAVVFNGCRKDVTSPKHQTGKLYMPQAKHNPIKYIMNPYNTDSTRIIRSYSAAIGMGDAVQSDIIVHFNVDTSLVNKYNSTHSTSLSLLPQANYQLSKKTETIPAGDKKGSLLQLTISDRKPPLKKGQDYLLPITVSTSSNRIKVNKKLQTTYYLLINKIDVPIQSVFQAYLFLKAQGKPGFGFYLTMVAGKDSLTVNKVYLVQGNSKFTLISGSLAMPKKKSLLLFEARHYKPRGTIADFPIYMQPLIDVPVIRPATLGSEIAGTYQALHLKISQAPDSLKESIDDKIGSNTFYKGGHYSLIVIGKYNDTKFTFKTEKNFDIPLKIDPHICVPANYAGVELDVTADVKKWFKGMHGFLDPSDINNRAAIDANIDKSFSIKFRTGSLPGLEQYYSCL